MDYADGLAQVGDAHALEHVAARAGPQRLVHGPGVVVH